MTSAGNPLLLRWLSEGATQEQILHDYPQLEPDDFLAIYAYAAELPAADSSSRNAGQKALTP